MSIDKKAFLAQRLPHDTVATNAGDVRVRGLNRPESMECQGLQAAELEKALMLRGLVDPVLTAEEIDAWYENAPGGEAVAIAGRIAELSGMTPETQKAATKSVRGGRRAGV